jgi:hypothetical protein
VGGSLSGVFVGVVPTWLITTAGDTKLLGREGFDGCMEQIAATHSFHLEDDNGRQPMLTSSTAVVSAIDEFVDSL